MSLITGCPSCGTLFRVVPDQLKISEGWVRCGHCAEVFDATAHLQDESVLAPAAVARLADSRPTQEDDTAAGPAHDDRPVPDVTVLSGSVPADPRLPSMPAPLAPARGLPDGQLVSLPRAALRRESEPAVAAPPTEGAGHDGRGHDAESEAADDDLTFLRHARRQAFWSRRPVRAVLALAALALAALLAGQVAVHERDRLALAQPELRPWLQRLCEPLGCAVEAPRRIDAIAIDSSGFTKLRPDSYRLSFTLRNNAGQPVAVPALELTLTDTQDQPVLRRVLLPRELGAPADTLGARGEWSSGVAVAVDGAAGADRIAGYRLLAFYP